MAYIETTKVSDNEIVKASDWIYAFDSQITNISTALQAVLESNQDFVINGKVKKAGDGGSMAVDVSPIFGICYSTGQQFLGSEDTENVSIPSSSTYDDIFTVEVKGVYEEYDNEQRAFADFETGIKTFQYIDTKKRLKVDVQVLKNESQSTTAPAHTEGWVKIAEIFVPANATSINECTINNITSDVAGEENSSWTNEKSVTYNIGYISDVNSKFRQQHKSDGTHKSDIIGSSELNYGTGAGQVNGTILPTGDTASLNGTSYGASTSITSIIKTICTKVTDLFNKYLVNGAFNFNGEIAISDLVSSNVLTNAVKIGAAGDGTAYIKVGNDTILTITSTGILRCKNGYTASATNDLITKSVTDALALQITSLSTRIEQVNERFNGVEVFANNTLTRFSSEITVTAASTANVNVTTGGLLTIDGVALSANNLVLLKNQTNKKQNGIWTAQTGAWNRGSYTTEASLRKRIRIIYGTTNIGNVYIIPQTGYTITNGTASIDLDVEKTHYSVKEFASTVMERDTCGRSCVVAPVCNCEIANKGYVDSALSAYAKLSGAKFTSTGFAGALCVERNSTGVAAIRFNNCSGILGYFGAGTANGRFVRYDCTASTSYTILDTSAAVTVEQGGTGATTAAAARTNLGLGTAATCASTAFLSATGKACCANNAELICTCNSNGCTCWLPLLFVNDPTAAGGCGFKARVSTGISTYNNAAVSAGNQGVVYIALGNSLPTTCACNAKGILKLFGTNIGYHYLCSANTGTSVYCACLPNSSGTIALTSSTVEKACCVCTAAASASSPTYVLGGISGSSSGKPTPYNTACLCVKYAASAASAASAANATSAITATCVCTGAPSASCPTFVLGGIGGSSSGKPIPYSTSCLCVKYATCSCSVNNYRVSLRHITSWCSSQSYTYHCIQVCAPLTGIISSLIPTTYVHYQTGQSCCAACCSFTFLGDLIDGVYVKIDEWTTVRTWCCSGNYDYNGISICKCTLTDIPVMRTY